MFYSQMRPRALVARRLACPVAYLPIGILEWHGYHNPLGLDGVKAERLAARLAGKFGGLVLPPLYWGDHRAESVEVICDSAVSEFPPPDFGDHVTPICAAMKLSRNRLEFEAARSTAGGGWRLWEELVLHTLSQAESLGFELIVPYVGHGPMHSRMHRLAEKFRDQGGRAGVLVLTDHLVDHGDHAAAFETSLLLALAPELVDLTELSASDTVHLGVVGEDPLLHASAEAGWIAVAKFETIVGARIAALRQSQ